MAITPSHTLCLALKQDAFAELVRAFPEPILKLSPRLSVQTGDRALIACLDDRHSLGMPQKYSFRGLWCVVATAQNGEIRLQVAIDFPRLWLSELDSVGAGALLRSLREGGNIVSVPGTVKISAPHPAGRSATNRAKAKIRAAAEDERQFGAARRKARVTWKLGRGPGHLG